MLCDDDNNCKFSRAHVFSRTLLYRWIISSFSHRTKTVCPRFSSFSILCHPRPHYPKINESASHFSRRSVQNFFSFHFSKVPFRQSVIFILQSVTSHSVRSYYFKSFPFPNSEPPPWGRIKHASVTAYAYSKRHDISVALKTFVLYCTASVVLCCILL